MKLKLMPTLFTAMILFSIFTGCGSSSTEDRLDAVEDSIDNKLDSMEDSVDNSNENSTEQPVKNTSSITEAEAIAIALKHANLSENQVNFLHSEYEIDDGMPQYEIEFQQDRFEHNYTINAETGAIVSFDKED